MELITLKNYCFRRFTGINGLEVGQALIMSVAIMIYNLLVTHLISVLLQKLKSFVQFILF
jgi:hypothetical protein